MPHEDVELPQYHGKYQKERLYNQPDWIEAHHLQGNSKVLAGIMKSNILNQDAKCEDKQSQAEIEEHHQKSTPIHESHGKKYEEELRIELDLIFHV